MDARARNSSARSLSPGRPPEGVFAGWRDNGCARRAHTGNRLGAGAARGGMSASGWTMVWSGRVIGRVNVRWACRSPPTTHPVRTARRMGRCAWARPARGVLLLPGRGRLALWAVQFRAVPEGAGELHSPHRRHPSRGGGGRRYGADQWRPGLQCLAASPLTESATAPGRPHNLSGGICINCLVRDLSPVHCSLRTRPVGRLSLLVGRMALVGGPEVPGD